MTDKKAVRYRKCNQQNVAPCALEDALITTQSETIQKLLLLSASASMSDPSN